MTEILKYVIDKGGYFGITCVFILLFSSVLLKNLNKKVESSEKIISNLLNFVRYFSIVSIAFIFGIKAFNAFDNSKIANHLINSTEHNKDIYINKKKINLAQILVISDRYKIQFFENKTFSIIKTDKSYWTNKIEIDTVYKSEITDIKEVILYSFESLIVIKYNQPILDSEIALGNGFNLVNTLKYFNSLKYDGYNIKIDNNIISWTTIIAILIFFIGFLLAISEGGTSGGCSVIVLTIIIVICLVSSLRGCSGYYYQ